MNRPLHAFSPYQRDGPQNVDGNLGGFPNYPSSFQRNRFETKRRDLDGCVGEHEKWAGEVMRVKFEVTEEDFVQPRLFWEVLRKQEGQQEALAYNVACHLRDAKAEVRRATYKMFARVDGQLGAWLEKETEKKVRELV